MQEPLLHSITRLLRYQRTPEAATARFQMWKHDADILPKLQQQLEMFLAAHGKFREVIYNTQGILDDGSDMIIRIPPLQNETLPRLICFQAKSFSDLARDSYMQELKAQRDDTFRKVHGLEYYFLLLCTDMTDQKHKKKVRNIMAEFRSAALTEVIEPAYAYTFLHHPLTRIDAFVKRTMEEEDVVFKQAMLELENLEEPFCKGFNYLPCGEGNNRWRTQFSARWIIVQFKASRNLCGPSRKTSFFAGERRRTAAFSTR